MWRAFPQWGKWRLPFAHEVNQPLTAIVTNGNAATRWLAGTRPNLDEANDAVNRIIKEGTIGILVINETQSPLAGKSRRILWGEPLIDCRRLTAPSPRSFTTSADETRGDTLSA